MDHDDILLRLKIARITWRVQRMVEEGNMHRASANSSRPGALNRINALSSKTI